MKVGDLVKYSNWHGRGSVVAARRTKGIIIAFDEEDDPIVLWFDSFFFGQPEANFRKHIVVLSGC